MINDDLMKIIMDYLNSVQKSFDKMEPLFIIKIWSRSRDTRKLQPDKANICKYTINIILTSKILSIVTLRLVSRQKYSRLTLLVFVLETIASAIGHENEMKGSVDWKGSSKTMFPDVLVDCME